MSKSLVAYFSATGITAKVAERLAEATGSDLFEIKPVQPYTEKDLDWTDTTSRTTIEMKDKPDTRPEIAEKVKNMDSYDTIYIGFPIWWYTCPKIINTFLESYDLTGKKVVPFATSGTSGYGNTNESVKASTNANLTEGTRFAANISADQLKNWADNI
jgi:flavodoxin